MCAFSVESLYQWTVGQHEVRPVDDGALVNV